MDGTLGKNLGFKPNDLEKWIPDILVALQSVYLHDSIDYLVKKYKNNPLELAMVMWIFTNVWRDYKGETLPFPREFKPQVVGTVKGQKDAIVLVSNDPDVLKIPGVAEMVRQFVKSMEDDKK